MVTVTLDTLAYEPAHGWANYAKGVLDALLRKGYKLDHGFDLLVDGDLPTASGLSSSASLEVLVGHVAITLNGLSITKTELALVAQEAENSYMGMHCGIMDQLSITMGKKDYAMMMDTGTLDIEYLPARFDGFSFIIMNTHYERKTTDSKYNARRQEANEALVALKEGVSGLEHLCQLTPEQFDTHKHLIKDPVIMRRARHAVHEQARVMEAKDALRNQDALLFGRLLNASHASLKDDYEVTGPHLDALTEAARASGAIGARVTGAGFGGCAIALVEDDLIPGFEDRVNAIYHARTGIKASFYPVTFTDGVREENQ